DGAEQQRSSLHLNVKLLCHPRCRLLCLTLHRYDDCLVVPIVENTPEEKDLKDRMARAMEEYPDSCAVLVRRHGVYVWGESWEKAKTMCECYDYLFDIAVQMKQCGLDPSALPTEEKGIM
ncbi:methylthioribulose-1-phosphate dehydratase-like, partial [Stegastes partitus]|uniref:Methylthioribulose-1-phosphate dehydratase-like n=1 Tax=Stegastes partitus TaxID=144197 RepID=A0A9Y4KNE3_9TELE